MRIVFSRKGFDTSSGGGPSPIVAGRPVSLPIPDTRGIAQTTYGDLGLGEHVNAASRGRLGDGDFCHDDPLFTNGGECIFGQCGAAQTHLERQGVGQGDVFLFFGLFRTRDEGEPCGKPHHRIFGYLQVREVTLLADGVPDDARNLRHPHALRLHARNDCLWRGEGQVAARASAALRLTVPGGPPSHWHRPNWLKRGGLTYHDRPDRWLPGRQLKSVARGQEFVADIGRREAPRRWLADIIAAIKASG
jgi:hypothetical protein